MASGIVPAGTVNIESRQESVKQVEEVNVAEIEKATEAMEEARKKLQGVAINLSSIEKRLDTKVDDLNRNISIISTLLSHLETVMEEDMQKRTRNRPR